MKNYDFRHLPESFGIDTKKEANHPRLDELKSIFEERFKDEHAFQFIGVDNTGRWNSWGKGSLACSLVENISLDDFFALVDDLRVENGIYVTATFLNKNLIRNKAYKVFVKSDGFYITNEALEIMRVTSSGWRNSTSYEIESLNQEQIPIHVPFLDWKVGDSMKCIKDYMDIKAGEECKIVDKDSDLIYLDGEHGQEQDISYSVLLKHFEKVVWMPKHKEPVLATLSPLSDFIECEYGIYLDGIHYVYDTLFEAIILHQAVEIKPIEKQIPYLTQIEELIKKSNAESDFSVLTLNIEKK